MTKHATNERIDMIEKIYQEYLAKMANLKKEQDRILADFVKELEKNKIEEIRKNLNNKF